MSGENLEGITGITDSQSVSDEQKLEEVRNKIKEIEGVDDLSDLANILGAEEELEGIGIDVQEDDAQIRRQRQATRQLIETQTQVALERQVQELREIEDDTELLREIATSLSTTNNRLNTVISELEDLKSTIDRFNGLLPKDFDKVEIERANSSRDLTAEDDLSSSFILVKASTSNDGSLFIGGEAVSTDNGFELEPGQSQEFPLDAISEDIRIVSEESNESYTYITFGIREQ